MGLISRLPWWMKMGAKIGLARLPIPYSFWKKAGLFRHGEMMIPERAISAFENHFADATFRTKLPSDFHSLELGPGDSVLSGFVARGFGAGKAWLVDAGRFADTDLKNYSALVEALSKRGKPIPYFAGNTLEGAMTDTNVVYRTDATRSLVEIPDASIDFVWSQVVLEHIHRDDFPGLMRELRRVMQPDAIGVHSIDFRDHLGGRLNNLRFADTLWESEIIRTSGFYTNRIRPREMVDLMRNAGFSIEIINQQRWPSLPLARKRMAPQFAPFDDEDFMVCEMRVVMRPA